MSENPKKFRRRRRFVQQFGKGMEVMHEEHGRGFVVSAKGYKIQVHFPASDRVTTLEARDLQFTEAERTRREKLWHMMKAGGIVTAACAPETRVVHRLLGPGQILAHEGPDMMLMVWFENDYADPKGEVVSVLDLRVIRQ